MNLITVTFSLNGVTSGGVLRSGECAKFNQAGRALVNGDMHHAGVWVEGQKRESELDTSTCYDHERYIRASCDSTLLFLIEDNMWVILCWPFFQYYTCRLVQLHVICENPRRGAGLVRVGTSTKIKAAKVSKNNF